MKPNTTGKYKHVKRLPEGALKVKEYAELQNITEQYVYNLLREGKHYGWDIVVYMGETNREAGAIHGRNYVVTY